MRPEQELTIFELRALAENALTLFDRQDDLAPLGPALAGVHWETDFAFIFFKGEPGPAALEFIYNNPALDLRHIHHMTYAQWQDGAGAEPFEVAGLTVAGITAQDKTEPKIIIDPGLAFGFGGHPTTFSCLEFLARACREKPAPKTALDLGAGTGVLSLAAAKWGLDNVLGVDYSHLAVDAALNNLALNGLESRVRFARGPAQDYAKHPAEILLANLHLSLQEELFALGAFENRRRVIISGLLPSEGDRLFEKLKSLGLKLIDQVRTDRWITMLLG